MASSIIMILCDTNILIEFYKNNEQITNALRQIRPVNLAVSAVTVAELYYGAFNKVEWKPTRSVIS